MWEHGTDQDHETGQWDERPELIARSRLRERGWTDKMVRELLGEADERRPNRRYPERPDMYLYLLERVEDVERTDAFFELLDQSERRKEAGEKAAQKAKETRLTRTVSQVEGLEIVLPRLEPDELIRRACESYNAWIVAEDAEREPATPEGKEWFLKIISVNFLRHSVPGYRELYDGLHRQPGAAEGRRRLNERIYQAIARMYPDLEEECERQNKRLLFPTPKQQAARERMAAQRQEAKKNKRR